MKTAIPERFYKSGNSVHCQTVGDLIEELQTLPRGLALRQGFGDGGILRVFNVDSDEPFLEICECEDDED